MGNVRFAWMLGIQYQKNNQKIWKPLRHFLGVIWGWILDDCVDCATMMIIIIIIIVVIINHQSIINHHVYPPSHSIIFIPSRPNPVSAKTSLKSPLTHRGPKGKPRRRKFEKAVDGKLSEKSLSGNVLGDPESFLAIECYTSLG